MQQKRLALMVSIIVLVLAACGKPITPPTNPSISITPSINGSVKPGENTQVPVTITRENFAGEVTVVLKDAPSGISATAQKTMESSAPLTVAIAKSLEPGDYPLTVSATGKGVSEAQGAVTLRVSPSVVPPPPAKSDPANLIQGTIENWDSSVVQVEAYSYEGELLGQDEIGKDGRLDLELRDPISQSDLKTTLATDFCSSGSSNLVATPTNLPGTIVFGIESLTGDRFIYEQSYPRGKVPLDNDIYVFRVYSAVAGSIKGSCPQDGLDLNLALKQGWNFVAASYDASRQTFTLESSLTQPAKANLVYETFANEPPVADFYAEALGFNEAYVDVSYASDSDGYIEFYELDMGDGTVYYFDSSDSYLDVIHPYAASGIYTITLTVYDDEEGWDSLSTDLDVYF